MYVIITFTCTYEKDPIKDSTEKVETQFSRYKFMEIFSDAQGQLILQPVVRFDQIWNCSELSCMFKLTVSMKRIGWKAVKNVATSIF